MLKRIGRRMLAATIAAGTIAAGTLFGAAAGQAQAGEVTFWTWRQEDRAAYTELFADFMKANPGITVKFEAFAVEQYATILSTALAAGKGGDVIHTRAYGGLEQFARAGYLLPLDSGNVPELANLPDDAKASLTLRSDGKVCSSTTPCSSRRASPRRRPGPN
jgi:raffinose/stachyose/melibiose transport system substrate-binding protein